MAKTERPLVLFVCQGNICRSPIATALAADAAQRVGLDIEVASAGTSALIGDPAEPGALACVAELGLDIGAHRARQVTPEMIEGAIFVVAATAAQRDWLQRLLPERRDRIASFGDITSLGDIPDPWGRNSSEYRRVRALIEEGMPALMAAVRERDSAAKGAPSH